MTTTISTQTTQPVQFHGYTIPAGTAVTLHAVVRDGYAGCSWVRTTLDNFERGGVQVDWNVAMPTWALGENVWELGLPIDNR
jgi:hypothetical protein